MVTVKEAAATLGISTACDVLGLPRATFYRRQARPPTGVRRARRAPARALPAEERQQVLDVLHEPRFVDQAPAEVYAQLLGEGRYLCSERTMYRVLAASAEVRERRDQCRHTSYPVPQLLASKPRELWSWDITKVPGPFKWTWYYVYVVLDVFSRFVVGWMVAHREHNRLAERLIRTSLLREGIGPGALTIHADRGPAMMSKPVAFLMADLGVTKSHSRPHVSDDNPYSEAQFKTLKYRPDFPEAFPSIHEARAFLQDFFRWYNFEHHHSGLALFTPADVHHDRIDAVVGRRQAALDAAFALNPERFPNGRPVAKRPPVEAWINRPQTPQAPHVGEPSGERAGAVKAGAAGERSERSLDGPEHSPTLAFFGAGRVPAFTQEVEPLP